MKNYILRRVLIIIPELLGMALLSFVLLNLLGDPFAELRMNPFISAADITHLQHMYGFDRPVLIRFFLWIGAVLRGNLGISVVSGESVLTIIGRALPVTLSLALVAFALSVVIGVLIGYYSGVHQYSMLDHFTTGFSYFGIAMPSFWFSLMLMILFSVKLPLFPPGGYGTPGMDSAPFIARFVDKLHYIVLPTLVITVGNLAGWARYTRSSILEGLRKDYVRTARSKGLPERQVLWRHVFRNAINPLVTLFFMSLPGLFSGSAVTESIFAIPGMGRMTIDAVLNNDYMVAMGCLMMYALLLLGSLFIGDLMYAVIDPRVKYS
jgi:peptide/nickel transport system permease protein